MPQSERAQILRTLVKWISEKEEGQTQQAIVSYVRWEITEGGATANTAKKYIDDLKGASLIELKHPNIYRITNAGKSWLERHAI